MSVVSEPLRGADLESAKQKYGAKAATLPQCCHSFLAGGEQGLKIRQEDLVN